MRNITITLPEDLAQDRSPLSWWDALIGANEVGRDSCATLFLCSEV